MSAEDRVAPHEMDAMQRALELAAAGLGRTSPNPSVGCVVLDVRGAIVGEGTTAPAGGPHAEVTALAAAGPHARGGTAVVTLEPCNHTGRTGPCVQALLAAGIRRVVYAVPDPNPVASGGALALAQTGVDVVGGVRRAEAERVIEAWLHGVHTGRPFVVWKLAATIDGRSAALDGSSRWITSDEARADVHALRSRCDAVVVGVNTVLIDDPQLTVRDGEGRPAEHQPLRVVLDARGRTPRSARVRDTSARTVVVTASDVGHGAGGTGVDLDRALDHLFSLGVRAVLLEGGPTLAGAFIDARLVDRIVAYIAPAVLGQGTPAILTRHTGRTIDGIERFVVDGLHRVGPDIRVELRPGRSDGGLSAGSVG